MMRNAMKQEEVQERDSKKEKRGRITNEKANSPFKRKNLSKFRSHH